MHSYEWNKDPKTQVNNTHYTQHTTTWSLSLWVIYLPKLNFRCRSGKTSTSTSTWNIYKWAKVIHNISRKCGAIFPPSCENRAIKRRILWKIGILPSDGNLMKYFTVYTHFLLEVTFFFGKYLVSVYLTEKLVRDYPKLSTVLPGTFWIRWAEEMGKKFATRGSDPVKNPDDIRWFNETRKIGFCRTKIEKLLTNNRHSHFWEVNPFLSAKNYSCGWQFIDTGDEKLTLH